MGGQGDGGSIHSGLGMRGASRVNGGIGMAGRFHRREQGFW